MATPRRQIIRPAAPTAGIFERQVRAQKLRSRLEHERSALTRWWKRLRRAVTAVEKHQKTLARLERQLAQNGGNPNGSDH